MAKKTLVNKESDDSVLDNIENVENPIRKEDSKTLLELFKKVTRQEPKLWGGRMIGFGKFSYKRKNGDEFEWFNTGFAPNKANMTVYVIYDINKEGELLEQLGPHKTGKGCLYVKKLDDINLDALEKLIAKTGDWD